MLTSCTKCKELVRAGGRGHQRPHRAVILHACDKHGSAVVSSLAGRPKYLDDAGRVASLVPLLLPSEHSLPFAATLEVLEPHHDHLQLGGGSGSISAHLPGSSQLPAASSDVSQGGLEQLLDLLYVLSGEGVVTFADGSARTVRSGDSLIAWHSAGAHVCCSTSDKGSSAREPLAVLKFHLPLTLLNGAPEGASPGQQQQQGQEQLLQDIEVMLLGNACSINVDPATGKRRQHQPSTPRSARDVLTETEAFNIMTSAQARTVHAVNKLHSDAAMANTQQRQRQQQQQHHEALSSQDNVWMQLEQHLHEGVVALHSAAVYYLRPLVPSSSRTIQLSPALASAGAHHVKAHAHPSQHVPSSSSASIANDSKQGNKLAKAVGNGHARAAADGFLSQRPLASNQQVGSTAQHSSTAERDSTVQHGSIAAGQLSSTASSQSSGHGSSQPPVSNAKAVLMQRAMEEFRAFRFPNQTNKLAFVFDPSELGLSLSFGVEVFEPLHVTPLHEHHSAHETFFVLAGEGVAHCNGCSWPVRAGDVAVFPPGSKHGIDNGPNGKLYCLQLMAPNEHFVEFVKGGEYVGRLTDADLCKLTATHC